MCRREMKFAVAFSGWAAAVGPLRACIPCLTSCTRVSLYPALSNANSSGSSSLCYNAAHTKAILVQPARSRALMCADTYTCLDDVAWALRSPR